MALADKSNVFKCKTKCLSGTDANKCHIVMISIVFYPVNESYDAKISILELEK